MAIQDTPRWLALTFVKPDRRDEFEAFLRDVVVAAVRRVRPEAMGRWQALRPGREVDSSAVYALLFYGDQPMEYWDLDALFTEAYGPDEAARRGQELDDMMTGEQQVLSFEGDVTAG